MAATVGLFVAGSLNGTVLPDLEDSDLEIGQVLSAPEQDGQPTKQLLVDVAPLATIKTLALDVLLALNTSKFATKGVALASTGFVGYVPDSAADAGKGTTGTKWSIANGICIPESLDAELDAAGSITAKVHGRSSDGDAAPWAVATAQALPAFASGNMFSLGRCEYNGTAMTWVQRVAVAFGMEIKRIKGDGTKFSNKVLLVAIKPVITLTVADQELASTLTILGARQGASASHIHLRAFDPAATRKATDATSHIQLAINGLNSLVLPKSIKASNKGEGLVDLSYMPVWDGTNEQIAVTTGVVYS